MKSRQGYKGYVIVARSCELREGEFSAEFSVEEHGVSDGTSAFSTVSRCVTVNAVFRAANSPFLLQFVKLPARVQTLMNAGVLPAFVTKYGVVRGCFTVALPYLLLGDNPQCLCGSWRDPAGFFPVFLVLIRLSRSLEAWTVNRGEEGRFFPGRGVDEPLPTGAQ